MRKYEVKLSGVREIALPACGAALCEIAAADAPAADWLDVAGAHPPRVHQRVEASIARLASLFPGRPAARRARALTSMAAAVGAVLLARATDDDAMRAELLSATAAMILGSKGKA